MVERDTYWKRRRVEPCSVWEDRNGMAYTELHMRLPVGTFVKVEDRLNGLSPTSIPGIVEYGLVGPGKYDTWDSIYEKLFTIYFEPVTKDEELGLIALAELE